MGIRRFFKDIWSKVSQQEDKLLNRSEVFCMAPWIQLHAGTNGKVAPCSMAYLDDLYKIGDLRRNPDLAASWNSTRMKKLRLNMLNGQKSPLCSICYKYEGLGQASERKHFNRDFKKHFYRINATNPEGSLNELSVPVIDIRFSNKCNFKCRICTSQYSSLWFEEEQKLNIATFNDTKVATSAADTAAFWQSYKRMLPHVERIHFAGGEPLFMDEHYDTLTELIAIGNTDAMLCYNTNFSTLRYKQHYAPDIWNKFRQVDIWASLDGMLDKGDYQRKGQKWEKIEENIRTVQQNCPGVIFGVNLTVSILNILDIPAFYRYMVENKLVKPDRMNLYLLFSPSQFCITNLTPELKQKAIQQFDELEKNYLSTLPDSENIRKHISTVVAFMTGAESDERMRDKFKSSIRSVDALRDENFMDTFPELREMVDG